MRAPRRRLRVREGCGWRRLLGAAILASALLTSPAGAEIPRETSFVEAVNKAIDKGAEWVLAQQQKDGGWVGYDKTFPGGATALAYHTLRVCGVSRTDPRMERAYAALRKQYVRARKRKMLRTYSVALTMMAVEQHGTPAEKPAAGRRPPAGPEVVLDRADLAWMEELVDFLEKRQNGIGTWRYGALGASTTNYDHSNSQYALLGLRAASRCGVKVRVGTYMGALQHLLDGQEADGPEVQRRRPSAQGATSSGGADRARGWGYLSLKGRPDRDGTTDANGLPLGAYASMTAGSVGAIVICRSELDGANGYSARLDKRAETSVRDGIAWLGQRFAVDANPGHPGWLYYYLYAVERAGVLADVDWMGEHDWYGEGARYLLGKQQPDGRWVYSEPILVPTCFALLFLKRGTVGVRRGALTSSSEADSVNFAVAAKLSASDFEDLIDLVLSKWMRAPAGSTTRTELQRRTTAIGPRIVLPLLGRMNSTREEKRAAAYAFLDHATGKHFPFDPAAPPARRYEQMERWEMWFGGVAGNLAYDAKTGRLVEQ